MLQTDRKQLFYRNLHRTGGGGGGRVQKAESVLENSTNPVFQDKKTQQIKR